MLNSEEIYQQAHRLPALEKLRLAELLLADLDMPNPDIHAVWRDEAQRRWHAHQSGALKTVSYEAVMQKYKRKPSTHKSWRWPIPLNLRIVRRVRLADQGIYLASESTFYRILKAARQLKHRRSERPHQPRTKPKALSATAPG